ncbi:MAG: hypothetical protein WCC90_07165 [Methylocella sp.]
MHSIITARDFAIPGKKRSLAIWSAASSDKISAMQVQIILQEDPFQVTQLRNAGCAAAVQLYLLAILIAKTGAFFIEANYSSAKHRNSPAPLADSRGNLIDLLGAVRPSVAGVWRQRRDLSRLATNFRPHPALPLALPDLPSRVGINAHNA